MEEKRRAEMDFPPGFFNRENDPAFVRASAGAPEAMEDKTA